MVGAEVLTIVSVWIQAWVKPGSFYKYPDTKGNRSHFAPAVRGRFCNFHSRASMKTVPCLAL